MNNSGKKVKTYSRDRVNVIELLLPGNLDIESIISDRGRISGERLLCLLSIIYFRGMCKDHENFKIQMHFEELQMIGGGNGNYLKLIEYAIDKGIIERDPSFRVGYYSKDYRFKNRDGSFDTQQTYKLTAKNAIKGWNKRLEKIKEYAAKDKVLLHIYKSIDSLGYDGEAAAQMIQGCLNESKRNSMMYWHLAIQRSFRLFKQDKNGRVYTLPTQCNREIRQFFRYNGKPLAQVDVSCCQPLLHCLLYEEKGDEYDFYKTLCENGGLYQYLATRSQMDISTEEKRTEFKRMLFKEVFYSYNKTRLHKVAQIFSMEFPSLWNEMKKYKGDWSNELPNEMMSIESEIMIQNVARELTSDGIFPLVTIHDCIMCNPQVVDIVSHKIHQHFITIGLKPTIKVKSL